MTATREAGQEAIAFSGTSDAAPTRAVRAAREASVPIALLDAPEGSPAGHSLSPRDRLTAWFTNLDKTLQGGALLDTRPHSLRRARTHHHEAAAHWQAGLIRWPRIAWGYLIHLPAKALCAVLDWTLASPARAIVTAAVIFTVWHWG